MSTAIAGATAGSGLGLTMLRERARAMDVRLQIETAAGKGTTIRVALPSTYRSRMMQKLRIRDLPGLVKFAVQHGLTTL
jgi:signal transduction histidine kinase